MHCAIIVYKKIIAIADEHGIVLSPALYTSNVTGFPKTAAALVTTEGTSTTPNTNITNTAEQQPPNSTTKPPPEGVPVTEAPAANVLPERPRLQHLRAYYMWHHHCKPLEAMCAGLTNRGEPLKESTVM